MELAMETRLAFHTSECVYNRTSRSSGFGTGEGDDELCFCLSPHILRLPLLSHCLPCLS